MSDIRFTTKLMMLLPLRTIKAFKFYNGVALINNIWKKESNVTVYQDRKDLRTHLALNFKDKPVLYLEFGVFKGDSIIHQAELNTNPGSLFFGFDSFEGLPEKWDADSTMYEKGYFSTGGNVPTTNDKRVHFVRGVFQDVLVGWLRQNAGLFDGRQILVHMDADLYNSNLFVLSQLYSYIYAGTQLVFDDFLITNHDSEAFTDWTNSHLIDYTYVARTKDFNGAWINIVAKRKDYR